MKNTTTARRTLLLGMACSGLSVGSSTAEVSRDNLLAYYDFDGQADNQAPNGTAPSATLHGGARYVPGKNRLGQALELSAFDDGRAAYVSAGPHFNSAVEKQAIAVSFWQEIASPNQVYGFWLNSATAPGSGFVGCTPWRLDLHRDRIYDFMLFQGGFGPGKELKVDSKQTSFTRYVWQHFVFQRDSNGVRSIWVNGAKVATGLDSAPLPELDGQLAMGSGLSTVRSTPSFINSINGQIDEFAVWNTALEPHEILHLSRGNKTLTLLPEEPEPADHTILINSQDGTINVRDITITNNRFQGVPFEVEIDGRLTRFTFAGDLIIGKDEKIVVVGPNAVSLVATGDVTIDPSATIDISATASDPGPGGGRGGETADNGGAGARIAGVGSTGGAGGAGGRGGSWDGADGSLPTASENLDGSPGEDARPGDNGQDGYNAPGTGGQASERIAAGGSAGAGGIATTTAASGGDGGDPRSNEGYDGSAGEDGGDGTNGGSGMGSGAAQGGQVLRRLLSLTAGAGGASGAGGSGGGSGGAGAGGAGGGGGGGGRIGTFHGGDAGGAGGNGGRGGDGGTGGDGGRGGRGGNGAGGLEIVAFGKMSVDGSWLARGEAGEAGKPGVHPQNGLKGELGDWGFGSAKGKGYDGGTGGHGGDGGNGASGGRGGNGGQGGGGAGGTFKFVGSLVQATANIDVSGGRAQSHPQDMDGQVGRLIWATNTGEFAGTVTKADDSKELYPGLRAPNPHLRNATQTPLIPNLAGGSDIAGLLDETNAWTLKRNHNLGYLTLGGQDNARVAVMRFDHGPVGYEHDFVGFDMVLYVNLTPEPLGRPVMGEGDSAAELRDGGLQKNPSFGGQGATTLPELPPYGVYATLVPEEVTTFTFGYRDDLANRMQSDSIADGEIAYLRAGPAVVDVERAAINYEDPEMAGVRYRGEKEKLSFTGMVNVTVVPAEIASHVSWKLQGGPQWYRGDTSAQKVPLGDHRIVAAALPGWIPPHAQPVLVLPGHTPHVALTYRKAPAYRIGNADRWQGNSLGHQRVLHGSFLGFWILNAAEEIDRSAQLEIPGTRPHGEVSLQNGWLSYQPDPRDREPFQITIRSSEGSQTITIDPRPQLASEERVLNLELTANLPDPSASEYRSFVRQAAEVSGEHPRAVVSGHHLVLEEGTDLWEDLRFADSIEKTPHSAIALYAETVTVKSALDLQNAELVIHARTLRFATAEARFINGGDVELSCLNIETFRNDSLPFVLSRNSTLSAPFTTEKMRPFTYGGEIVQSETHGYRWMHPLALRHVTSYLNKLYYLGFYTETQTQLEDYLAWLRGAERAGYQAHTSEDGTVTLEPREEIVITNVPDFGDPTHEDATMLAFSQIATELESMLGRLRDNLDYFGNPLGWTPMLSFETTFSLTNQEIEKSINTLYLSYWLTNKAESLQVVQEALQGAQTAMGEENDALHQELGSLDEKRASILQEGERLGRQLSALDADLRLADKQLAERAKEIVDDRNHVPFWKQGLRSLATISKAIPIYQPALGSAGDALNVISRVDEQAPLETILEVGTIAAEYSAKGFDAKAKAINTELEKAKQSPQQLAASSLTANATGIRAASKTVNTVVDEIQSLLKTKEASATEIAEELDRLRASDPQFADLADRIEAANDNKARFARKVAQLESRLVEIPGIIQGNLLGMRGIQQALEHNGGVINPQSVSYLKAMEQRAETRLRKYFYWMAKSFEYRFLESYRDGNEGTIDLFDTFNRLKALAGHEIQGYGEIAPRESHQMDLTDFAALKAVFETQLSNIAERIVSRIVDEHRPEKTTTRVISLTASQLAELNKTGNSVLNLFEENFLSKEGEQFRIRDIRVSDVQIEDAGTSEWTPGSALGLEFLHGVSGQDEKPQAVRLTKSGETFVFNPRRENQNPRSWKSTLSLSRMSETNDRRFDYERPSLHAVSLLNALLPNSEEQEKFSRPAAWANIKIKRSQENTLGLDIELTAVELEIDLDYVAKDANYSEIEVRILDESIRSSTGLLSPYQAPSLSPRVWVGREDEHQRRDGAGAFVRRYQSDDPTMTTFEAERFYGHWEFVEWRRITATGTWEVATEKGWLPVSEAVNRTRVETATVCHRLGGDCYSLQQRIYAIYTDHTDRTPAVVEDIALDRAAGTTSMKEFVVTFSEPVVGVDEADFETGDGRIMAITGSGSTRRVRVYYPGQPSFELVDNDSIVGLDGNALGGLGEGNGDAEYTVTVPYRVRVIGFNESGNPRVEVTGPSNAQIWLQVSDNLEDWNDLGSESLTLSDGKLVLLDQEGATKRTRFYRLVKR